MAVVSRTALIHAIKGAIGRLDEHGREIVDPDEVDAENAATPLKRPSAEQKKKVVDAMVARDQAARAR